VHDTEKAPHRYLEQVFIIARSHPKGLVTAFVLSAWYFCYNLMCLMAAWSNVTVVEVLYRGAFLFGGITMIFGPFLVITPTNPIVLKKESLLKRVVRQAQREETRRTTFAIFCLLTLLQGFVIYSLYDVLLNILQMSLALVLVIWYVPL
jgi:hypothetical protein